MNFRKIWRWLDSPICRDWADRANDSSAHPSEQTTRRENSEHTSLSLQPKSKVHEPSEGRCNGTMKTVEVTYRYGGPGSVLRPRPADAYSAQLRLNEGNRAFAALLEGLAEDDGIAHCIVEVDPQDLGVISAEGAPRQRPFAAVLGCSDARVPVELIFNALVHEYPGTGRHSGFPMAHGASEGRIGDPDARTVAWQAVPYPDVGTHAV